MNEIEKVRAFLQSRDGRLNIIEMDANTSTAFLAAQALGTEVERIAKSILFKTRDDHYVMVVSTGDVKIDTKAMKALTGARVRMANAEEVRIVTGYSIGGVCPFALQQEIPIYLDESLKRFEVVYAAAGTANTAVPVSFDQLRSITHGIPCKVSIDQ